MRQVSSLAVDACDGGGYREFELIEPSDGQVVAAAWRHVECHQAQRAARVKTAKHEELLGTIGCLKTQQNGLTTTMERKNRMMMGVSKEMQNKFLKEVLILEKRLPTWRVNFSGPMRSYGGEYWENRAVGAEGF